LEPVIFGKTTGISALGLLVAAMFWTWLWGALGLLLSTPLTVCLAVLGKYVPSLWFFAALLSEEAELEPDVRFYQRLVALDREGAIELVETALRQSPRVEVFDNIIVPALSRSERDAVRDELDDATQSFVWQVVSEVLDTLEGTPDFSSPTRVTAINGETRSLDHAPGSAPVHIVGLVADDTADSLVLRMLSQLLPPSSCHFEIITDTESSLEVVERVAEQSPSLVVVSHLPPEGSTLARYLVRRLRAHFADLPIVVGRWSADDDADTAAERLTGVGASRVVLTLADARARILSLVAPVPQRQTLASAARA
jgi:hypothetical protein